MITVSYSSTVKTKVLRAFERRMRDIIGGELRVGLNPNMRYAKGGKTIRVTRVALINEFGTRDGHVPARHLMRRLADRYRLKYVRMLRSRVAKYVQDGKVKYAYQRIAQPIGSRMVADFRKTIISNAAFPSPPNAKTTERIKGFNNPMYHTGRLARAMEWKWVRTAPKRPIKELVSVARAVDGFKRFK